MRIFWCLLDRFCFVEWRALTKTNSFRRLQKTSLNASKSSRSPRHGKTTAPNPARSTKCKSTDVLPPWESMW